MSFTVRVAKVDGSPLWGETLATLAEAMVYVLEEALPNTMALGDAVKAADRVLAGERVEIGDIAIQAVKVDEEEATAVYRAAGVHVFGREVTATVHELDEYAQFRASISVDGKEHWHAFFNDKSED